VYTYSEPICYKTGIYYISCNCVVHVTDMYLTIQIQHNTVYLTFNCHPKGVSTALITSEPGARIIEDRNKPSVGGNGRTVPPNLLAHTGQISVPSVNRTHYKLQKCVTLFLSHFKSGVRNQCPNFLARLILASMPLMKLLWTATGFCALEYADS
jgi:hypothetical protein